MVSMATPYMTENRSVTSILGGNQTYIEHIGHLIISVFFFSSIGPLKCKKIVSSKLNALWLYEMSWFPLQPIMRL